MPAIMSLKRTKPPNRRKKSQAAIRRYAPYGVCRREFQFPTIASVYGILIRLGFKTGAKGKVCDGWGTRTPTVI